jgi:hypothetical protein
MVKRAVFSVFCLALFYMAYTSDYDFRESVDSAARVVGIIIVAMGALCLAYLILKYALPAINDHQDRVTARQLQHHEMRLRESRFEPSALGLPALPAAWMSDPQVKYAILTAYVQAQIENPTTLVNPRTAMATEDATSILVEPDVPTFADLLDTDTFGRNKPLLMAYDESGMPITGKAGSLYTVAIGGLPEMGKSTTARFLASQMALKGCKLVLGDPHGNATGDAADDTLAITLAPLSSAFLLEPATDHQSVLESVRYVSSELDKRIAGATAHHPILLVLDEFSTLMRDDDLSDTLSPLLESLATQGRKFLVYAMLLGQQWSVSRTGGGELRDVLASAYVHRLKMKQASMLTGLTRDEIGYPVDKLDKGQVLLYRTNGDLIPARVPMTTAADMRRVAYLLDEKNSDSMAIVPTEFSRNRSAQRGQNSVEIPREFRTNSVPTEWRPNALNAKETQVRELLRQKVGGNDILREVWQVDPKRNDMACKKAREEYQEIVAKLVGGA